MNLMAADTWLSPSAPVGSLSSKAEDLEAVLSYHFGTLISLALWLAGDWYSIRLNTEVMASSHGNSSDPPFLDKHRLVQLPGSVTQAAVFNLFPRVIHHWEGGREDLSTIAFLSSVRHYYREHKGRWLDTPTEISVNLPCFYLLSIITLSSQVGQGRCKPHSQAGPFPKGSYILLPTDCCLPLPHKCSRHNQMHLNLAVLVLCPTRTTSLLQFGKGQLCPSRFCEYSPFCSAVRAESCSRFVECSLSSGWEFRNLHVLLIPLGTDH